MDKQRKLIRSRQEWADFALGYILLAGLAFEEIEHPKHYESVPDMNSVFIPALYTLKHGIELLLKYLCIELMNKDVFDSTDKSHDIDLLFSRLRGIPKINETLKKEIDTIIEQQPELGHIWSGTPSLDVLEGLVKKYYYLEMLKEHIGSDFSIIDADNTALKYPTNDLTIQLDYVAISKKFTKIDVLNAQRDCLRLRMIMFQLYPVLRLMNRPNVEKDNKALLDI